MILDNSNGRLAEIKAFAKEHDLMESFNETFSRLENYSTIRESERTRVLREKDERTNQNC
ncbi:MAG TPA: hypothetical protein VLQ91_03545 [Draconibacterium sp.]|nr:hypothetical protein [Draconibacterium sp.]